MRHSKCCVRAFGIFFTVLLALGILSGGPANAQSFSGVTGVVRDPSGGAVPDADVKLTNAEKGFSAETKTNDVGGYDFRQVPPASGYTLTFSKANFRTLVIGNVALAATQIATQDGVLDVGDVKTTVEVSGGAGQALNTTDATISSEIDTQKVQDLPSLFRTNAAALLTLAPGVISADDNGPENDSQLGSVTGSRADQGNITLDGMDVNDETIGQAFSAVGSIPIDTVQEVNIVSGSGNADFGRSEGGQIALVTKSGTNDWHGSVHEYNRNTIFAANSFFNNKDGIGRQALNRNQFGASLGGPIKKDKLFFFFNYEALREGFADRVEQIVPLDSFRAGEMSYINSNAGCTGNSRQNSTPNCITTLTPTQVRAMDPANVGVDTTLLSFINSRYPHANDLTVGDGVNTGGFLFTPPVHFKEGYYTGRIDFNINTRNKLFARMQYNSINDDQQSEQFPGDPDPVASFYGHDRTWVIGETWNPTNDLVNNISVGVSRQVADFPVNFRPTAPNEFSFGPLTAPFNDVRGQARNVAVPEIRDDLTYAKGKHTLQFGTDVKPIHIHSFLQNDINFVTVGTAGFLFNLNDALRPSDINNSVAADEAWDNSFLTLLGTYSQTSSFFNYDKSGTPEPQGTGRPRYFVYNEYEFYGQDSWHIRSDLTMTFGLRWQVHSVPYEANGFESVPSVNINQLFDARLSAAAQGVEGNNAAPLVSYNLGGKANNAPGYANTDWHDFGPRLGIAYSPSVRQGFLGKVLGDRKTSIRAGAGIVYDRVLSTLSFELDQSTFLFDSNPTLNLGIAGDPVDSVAGNPRFTGLNSIPASIISPPPAVTPRPFTPNVDSAGDPIGLAGGGFPRFFQFDKNIKTPYAYTISFGVQRELPDGWTFEANYFGRLGRKLIAVGDAGQVLDFKDAASGQGLKAAYAGLETQILAGTPLTGLSAQPWFENQLTNQLAALGFPAGSCPSVAASFLSKTVSNCTGLAAATINAFGPFLQNGDLSSSYLSLAEFGIVPPNSGMLPQTGSAGYIGNYSDSSYNSLLISVKKRFTHNFTSDFYYTYSHSIDNQSIITNDFVLYSFNGQGLICDLTNLRTCRADSTFDARHLISWNYDYYLPVGHKQRFLGDSPGWVNAIVGGWATSGILTFRTGLPMNTHTGAFPINFTQDAPAVFNGDFADTSRDIHTDPTTGSIQFFKDQTTALSAFSFPFGGDTGTRNPLHGPDFFNLDIAVFKNFVMPWSDRQKLQFRWEAFNVFNNVMFAQPGSLTLADPSEFGVINATANSARQMQFSLRYDF